MVKIRRTPESTASTKPPAGVYVKVPDGAPSPVCQWPGCHRRASYAYRDRKTRLRCFRPWCKPHRPGSGRSLPAANRPRPYFPDPEIQPWPDEVRCPFCPRKREPKGGGVLRRTCRQCRGLVRVGEQLVHRRTLPGARKPAVKPARLRLVKKPPPPPTKVINKFEVSFKESGKRHTILLDRGDYIRLDFLWRNGIGHYASATDTKLTRKYPTAAIAALFGRWERQ